MKAIKSSTPRVVVSLTQLAVTGFLLWDEMHRTRPSRPIRHSVAAAKAKPVRFDARQNDTEASQRDQVSEAALAILKHEPYWKALWHVALSAAKAWSAHRAASKGAALALYPLFSLEPMMVLIIT